MKDCKSIRTTLLTKFQLQRGNSDLKLRHYFYNLTDILHKGAESFRQDFPSKVQKSTQPIRAPRRGTKARKEARQAPHPSAGKTLKVRKERRHGLRSYPRKAPNTRIEPAQARGSSPPLKLAAPSVAYPRFSREDPFQYYQPLIGLNATFLPANEALPVATEKAAGFPGTSAFGIPTTLTPETCVSRFSGFVYEQPGDSEENQSLIICMKYVGSLSAKKKEKVGKTAKCAERPALHAPQLSDSAIPHSVELENQPKQSLIVRLKVTRKPEMAEADQRKKEKLAWPSKSNPLNLAGKPAIIYETDGGYASKKVSSNNLLNPWSHF